MTHCKKVIAIRRARGGREWWMELDEDATSRREEEEATLSGRCAAQSKKRKRKWDFEGGEKLSGSLWGEPMWQKEEEKRRQEENGRRDTEAASRTSKWSLWLLPGLVLQVKGKHLLFKALSVVSDQKLWRETEEVLIIGRLHDDNEISNNYKSKLQTRKKQASGYILVWIQVVLLIPGFQITSGLWLESLQLSWLNTYLKLQHLVVEK